MRPARPLLALLLTLLLVVGLAAPAWAATEEAVLAGGCFWCLEHDLEGLSGVLEVTSGYSGGKLANPSYKQVSGGGTGHREVVRVRFDSTRLRYEKLLRAYWRNVDPFDGGGQFCDRGESYRPAIFTTSANQAVEARNSVLAAARELGRPASAIKVEIKALNKFWPAEDYHQNYARRNGVAYRYYRWSCGRDRRLDAVWGKRARSAAPWGESAAAARQLPETEAAPMATGTEVANPVKTT
jgi:peptide-methionine (S)-S-oxide reductase